MTPCKRMTVYAVGVKDDEKYVEFQSASNGNATECTGEVGKCGCVHAEINLLKKLPHPDFVWVSHSPCLNCAKALVEAGVMKVDYVEEYRLREGIEYLEANGVEVFKVER